MIKEKTLSSDDLDTIWLAQHGKHDAIVKVMYSYSNQLVVVGLSIVFTDTPAGNIEQTSKFKTVEFLQGSDLIVTFGIFVDFVISDCHKYWEDNFNWCLLLPNNQLPYIHVCSYFNRTLSIVYLFTEYS